ncbi:MAG: urease accessory protein UreF [Paracoccaceae bacterium]
MSISALLTLTQWLSPSFPISAFAYSHGLEHVIDRGDIADADGLRVWISDILCYGGINSDGVLLAAAYRAGPADISDIDDVARAFAASSERLVETVDQGRAFSRTAGEIWDLDIPPLTYPVAVGYAAKQQDIPLNTVLGVFLQASAANLISAAVRLVPLGQTQGQTVLAGLAPIIRDKVQKLIASEIEDLSSNCFALDIAAMHHETQYSKVFRT